VVRPRAGAVATAVTAAIVLAGCASIDTIDITTQGFPVTFVNDTPRNVRLEVCADEACRHSGHPDRIEAGSSTWENLSDAGILTRLVIKDDATGRVLGCLPLEFHRKVHYSVVRISQAVPCPGRRPVAVEVDRVLGHP
jgi:hypothetical protein